MGGGGGASAAVGGAKDTDCLQADTPGAPRLGEGGPGEGVAPPQVHASFSIRGVADGGRGCITGQLGRKTSGPSIPAHVFTARVGHTGAWLGR